MKTFLIFLFFPFVTSSLNINNVQLLLRSRDERHNFIVDWFHLVDKLETECNQTLKINFIIRNKEGQKVDSYGWLWSAMNMVRKIVIGQKYIV
jgi:hypothetical protein